MKHTGIEITIGGPEPQSGIHLPDDFGEIIQKWNPEFIRIQNITMRAYQLYTIQKWSSEHHALAIITDCIIIGNNEGKESEYSKCQ